jgi:hypothetical protein
MDALMLAPVIQAALKTAVDQDEACLAEQIEITEIPAWPFGEHLRAADFVERFKRYGLTDVRIDEVGNVIGVRPGTGPEPRTKLIISAHLDTVFTETTDFKVRKEGNRYYAPSIGDDSRGLAGLLHRRGILRTDRLSLCVYGAFASVVLYGVLMNFSSAVTWHKDLSLSVVLAYCASGFPMDVLQGGATVAFLWLFGKPMLRKLERIGQKYGLRA